MADTSRPGTETRGPCPDGLPPPSDRPPPAPIGEDGRPIRAIAFAGGGFDTVMQLGVIHALLVSRGKPPDVVIGSSTGGVNAVALAEVFQASGDLGGRVARFRHLYEGYRSAPGRLAQAFRPDFFQVDTQRPLEPLQLPIHHQNERTERSEAVLSRAGLINLYNTLLAVRVTVGTFTQAVRRVLGLTAARDDSSSLRRALVTAGEAFRGWMLVGQNLQRLSPLVWVTLKALLRQRFGDDRGATAAELIFRSWAWRLIVGGVRIGTSLTMLAILWLGGAVLVALALALAGAPLAMVVNVIVRLGFWQSAGVALLAGAGLAPLLFAILGRQGRWRAFGLAVWTLILFAALVIGWTAALGIPLALVRGLVAAAGGEFLKKPWLGDPSWWIGAGIVALLVFIALALLTWTRRASLPRWLLAQFDLDKAIFSDYALRQILSSLFDPDYYGTLDMDAVVDNALTDDPSPRMCTLSEKRLDDYAATRDPGSPQAAVPPIHVLLTVVDLAKGKFKVLPGWWRVVDGLTAALAAVPLFPPVPCDDSERRRVSLLIDSSIVASEPTRPLFSYLRHSGLVNEKAAALHLYSVAALPFGRPFLGEELDRDRRPPEYNSLVAVGLRAWELKRFRDAALERRLTELVTWAMPRTDPHVFHRAALDPPIADGPLDEKRLLRTWVYAIEPERPLRVTGRMLQHEDETERRRIIAETVADGCRAALQVMLRPTIQSMSEHKKVDYSTVERLTYFATKRPVETVRCGAAIRAHLDRAAPLPGSAAAPELDSMAKEGPGLAEVCRHCAIFREPNGGAPPTADLRRALRVLDEELERGKRPWPAEGWPREGISEQRWTEQPRLATSEVEQRDAAQRYRNIRDRQWQGTWPLPRGDTPGTTRPTVSLLFSGGVFRGVFQVGALNALSEVSLQPDLVAGASVGSITAAMAARAFVESNGLVGEAARQARQRQIARVAATYLGMDRLVLTDRFADFIRGITVRAAQARFSVRDADHVFRRFDAGGSASFSRALRRVVAGIERLTYISPFELRDLLKAFRLQQFGRASRLLGAYFQEWLERFGVGSEVLGAEPLALLIRELVLEGLGPRTSSVGLDAFIGQGMFFLATATNLTRGELRILGANQLEGTGRRDTLLDSLLASSAFPGVFRPRWAWEISPQATNQDQFIDGGVMDNLPLDAVAQFLHLATTAGVVQGRPAVPHLLFCASLQEEVGPIGPRTLDELRHNWPKLRRHAQRVGYNEKLEIYSRTQHNLRGLARTRGAFGDEWAPLDLEVVAVLPRWLCSTFGFHPMLGFRRRKQAQSIAHGCAATLHRLAEAWRGYDGQGRMTGWGVETSRLPQRKPDESGRVPLTPDPRARDGRCWYQSEFLCPFSVQGQTACGAALPDATSNALAAVHVECGRPETHLP